MASAAVLSYAVESSENRFDEHGRLQRIALGAGWLELKTDLRAPKEGWAKIWGSSDGATTLTESNGRKFWHSRLGDGERADVEAIQVARETPTGIEYEFSASAFKSSAVEGVIFWLSVPAKIFGGGSFTSTGKDGKSGGLPVTFNQEKILASGLMESAEIKNADGSIGVALSWNTPVNVVIQDERQWSDQFAIMVFVQYGPLEKGSTSKLNLILKATGKPESAPAEFVIDAAKPRYNIDGIGGNYCFNLETPETDYTLARLKPTFARTEISLQEWTPAQGKNQVALDLKSMPGKLRLEFEMMRTLAARGIPFIASIWKAPDWLCFPRDPNEKNSNGNFKRLKPELLEAAAEATGAYLLYAKEKLNAEPDYFSFNEPDYGAQVKLSSAEHAEVIKVFGAHFKKLGLKTRQLLGDVSNPRAPMTYLDPALNDATAMQNVGAVSFHSWGGGTPEQYGAWSALAERLKLPLFVAEAGVDPGAWKGAGYKSYDNAVREMAHYQDIFQYARPQAILYWEYTGDYSLMTSESSPKKKPSTFTEADETERFALQRHLTQFIPPKSEAITVAGSNPHVRLTAFSLGNDLALNVSNDAWPRRVSIKGIPNIVQKLNVIQTTRGNAFQKLDALNVKDGAVEFDAPAQGMLTLTTR